MRSIFAFLLLVALPLASASAANDEKRYELSVSGSIDIGPDGSVIAHKLDRGLKPVVLSLIEQNIETWQFEPIEQDGKPVIATTSVRMALSAVPDGEDALQLRLDKVWFGEPKGVDKTTPPAYPRQALKDRIAARVVLTLQLDANGEVVDAHPYQTSLSRTSSEGRDARYRRYFEEASMKAAKEWTFTPGEMIDGVKLGASVMVPITFSISSGNSRVPGWQSFIPGPITPAPWSNSAALAAVDSGELEDGQAAVIDSRFQLKTPVAGTIL